MLAGQGRRPWPRAWAARTATFAAPADQVGHQVGGSRCSASAARPFPQQQQRGHHPGPLEPCGGPRRPARPRRREPGNRSSSEPATVTAHAAAPTSRPASPAPGRVGQCGDLRRRLGRRTQPATPRSTSRRPAARQAGQRRGQVVTPAPASTSRRTGRARWLPVRSRRCGGVRRVGLGHPFSALAAAVARLWTIDTAASAASELSNAISSAENSRGARSAANSTPTKGGLHQQRVAADRDQALVADRASSSRVWAIRASGDSRLSSTAGVDATGRRAAAEARLDVLEGGRDGAVRGAHEGVAGGSASKRARYATSVPSRARARRTSCQHTLRVGQGGQVPGKSTSAVTRSRRCGRRGLPDRRAVGASGSR